MLRIIANPRAQIKRDKQYKIGQTDFVLFAKSCAGCKFQSSESSLKTGSFLDGLESMQRQPEAVWLEFNAYAFVCKAKSSPRNLDEIP